MERRRREESATMPTTAPMLADPGCTRYSTRPWGQAAATTAHLSRPMASLGRYPQMDKPSTSGQRGELPQITARLGTKHVLRRLSSKVLEALLLIRLGRLCLKEELLREQLPERLVFGMVPQEFHKEEISSGEENSLEGLSQLPQLVTLPPENVSLSELL